MPGRPCNNEQYSNPEAAAPRCVPLPAADSRDLAPCPAACSANREFLPPDKSIHDPPAAIIAAVSELRKIIPALNLLLRSGATYPRTAGSHPLRWPDPPVTHSSPGTASPGHPAAVPARSPLLQLCPQASSRQCRASCPIDLPPLPRASPPQYDPPPGAPATRRSSSAAPARSRPCAAALPSAQAPISNPVRSENPVPLPRARMLAQTPIPLKAAFSWNPLPASIRRRNPRLYCTRCPPPSIRQRIYVPSCFNP